MPALMKKSKYAFKKIAVITGASEGIGAALVKELLKNNYKVIAISNSTFKTILPAIRLLLSARSTLNYYSIVR